MRTLAQWLVVPLLLLVVLAAAGLVLLAQEAHRRDLAPYREDGAAAARRWLASDDVHAHRLRRSDAYRRHVQALLDDEEGIPVEHPAGALVVLHPKDLLGKARWTFSAERPEGVRSDALADPSIRLQIEAGRAAVALDAVDVAGRAFGDLYERSRFDLDRLREAPLPADTKTFLVVRRLDAVPTDEKARAAARFLETIRAYERALASWPPALGRGAWQADGVHVLVDDPSRPRVVLSKRALGDRSLVLASDGRDDTPIRLVWAFPPGYLPRVDVVWAGRLEAPFAGAYAFQTKSGATWWGAPRVRRWGGPILGGLLVSLGAAVALFLHLRRRRRLDDARLRFLNELAHDLRTPLTSLRLHADLLAGDRAKPEKRKAYTARMATEAARLSALLANLLDLTRLERGRRTFTPESVSLPGLVGEAAREFASVFPGRAADLDVEAVAGTIRADRSALARVLGNLLENAGKFTPPGTAIRVRTHATVRGVDLVVEDDGPGIPDAERRHVFGRYARGRDAKRDGVPGTGLGLALVKDLVEGMGGRVSLGTPPVGAAFVVHLEEPSNA